ncbi:hypothetical protein AACH06_29970 [Ideonella sp. DXS29W]|uniref:DUF1090 family protein n=1 Tax=Ideonella lacteola TaxID=2984193 RepID=A0ABU9BYJ9_9BURK
MQKSLASSLAILACSLSLSVAAQPPAASGSAVKLPTEVRKLLERVALCDHLAGEYDAVNSPRTIEVSRSVELNRCDFVDQELQNMKKKYANSAAVLQEISRAESERSE